MKVQAYALFVGLVGLAFPGGASAQSSSAEDTGSAKAGIRFQQAVELYREGSYEGALAEFRKAYQISPSYRVLYNIAQTQYALHDFVSAYRSLKQYVAEGGSEIPADRRAQVDDMSAKLAERIARLDVSTDAEGADIRIDDVSAGRAPLGESVLVNVGTHKVSAVKAGSPEAVRVVTVAGRETLKVDIHVEPPTVLTPAKATSGQRVPIVLKTEAPERPSHAGLIVSLSTTTALAVGTGVFGYLALRAQNDFENQLKVYPTTKDKIENARTKSKNYGYITDAFGAATVLSGGAAIYFWLTSESSNPKPAKPAKATVVGLAPTLGGMVLQGNF
jgi:tetratricopeptide (TPR) repeat protein